MPYAGVRVPRQPVSQLKPVSLMPPKNTLTPNRRHGIVYHTSLTWGSFTTINSNKGVIMTSKQQKQPTASQPTEIDQSITDKLTLTCQRCGESWIRRDMTKLPKSCARCGSRYWQKPLTPYWESYRKEQAAQKLANEIQVIANQEEYIFTILTKLNQPDVLKIYCSLHQPELEPIRHLCNFWLPEKMAHEIDPTEQEKFVNTLYQPGNTIATTSEMLFRVARNKVAKGLLFYKKVFLIKIRSNTQYIYSLNPDGTTKVFWGYKWPTDDLDIVGCLLSQKKADSPE
jgi:DNA-directed RNA polymerase subunit RPC12/RpoP